MKTINKFVSYRVKNLVSLFAMLVQCVVMPAIAQQDYEPMLKDGRVWNCIEVYIGKEPAFSTDTILREYRIGGTSEIDGRVCYNFCLGSKVIEHFYEEGTRVFRRSSDGWELLFDFTLSPGDKGPHGLTVESLGVMEKRGKIRRCLYFGLWDCLDDPYCWIEGIGDTETGPYLAWGNGIMPGSLLCAKLLSVYDGEECVFEAKDLHADTETASPVMYAVGSTQSVYDLKGRRIVNGKSRNSKSLKGVYISGRKKYVR